MIYDWQVNSEWVALTAICDNFLDVVDHAFLMSLRQRQIEKLIEHDHKWCTIKPLCISARVAPESFKITKLDYHTHTGDYCELGAAKLSSKSSKRKNFDPDESDMKKWQSIIRKYYSSAAEAFQHINNRPCILESRPDLSLITIAPNYKYPVHNDSEMKRLSMVINLGDDNIGTQLVDYGPVPWKDNRAFAFTRNEDTFHWYESNNNYRTCLIYNIAS